MKNNPDIPVNKKLADSEIQIGCCIYCGQTYQLETDGQMGENALNEAAAQKCDCQEATKAQETSVKREKAHNNIESLFNDNAKDIRDALFRAVDMLLNGTIQSLSINNGRGITAKVAITSKGNIKVERAYSKKAVLED